MKNIRIQLILILMLFLIGCNEKIKNVVTKNTKSTSVSTENIIKSSEVTNSPIESIIKVETTQNTTTPKLITKETQKITQKITQNTITKNVENQKPLISKILYKDDATGISFYYKSNWVKKEGNEFEIASPLEIDGALFKARVCLEINKFNSNTSFEEQVKVQNELNKKNQSGRSINSVERNFAGNPGMYTTIEDEMCKSFMMWTVKNNIAYCLMYVSNKDYYDKDKQDVDEIFNSVVIK